MKDITCNWIPNKSLSVFRFGEKISKYTSTFDLEIDEVLTEGHESKSVYRPKNHCGITIYTNNYLVDSIICDDEFLYGGENLIGKLKVDAVKLVGIEPSEYGEALWVSEDEQQTTVEFDQVGLMLWVNSKDKVVSVTCDYVSD